MAGDIVTFRVAIKNESHIDLPADGNISFFSEYMISNAVEFGVPPLYEDDIQSGNIPLSFIPTSNSDILCVLMANDPSDSQNTRVFMNYPGYRHVLCEGHIHSGILAGEDSFFEFTATALSDFSDFADGDIIAYGGMRMTFS
ncbi:hypothetical protein KC711_07430 [Candidatus Peregrinibacteria bacterium]|nr:hypothetical protein [Candidatus Peregrinibacteria bacterium]